MGDALVVVLALGVVVALAWLSHDIRSLRKEIKGKHFYEDDGYF